MDPGHESRSLPTYGSRVNSALAADPIFGTGGLRCGKVGKGARRLKFLEEKILDGSTKLCAGNRPLGSVG